MSFRILLKIRNFPIWNFNIWWLHTSSNYKIATGSHAVRCFFCVLLCCGL